MRRALLAPLPGLALLLVTLLWGVVAAAPVPVPDAELHAHIVGFSGGSGDDGSGDDSDDDEDDEPRPFDIDASGTDLNVYAMDCFQSSNTFVEFRAEAYASTVANRSAHYLAVDVKLKANNVVRRQKFVERDGPTSAVSASVSYSAPCHDYLEMYSVTASGWHKGIGDRGSRAIYETTTDR